MAEQTKEFVIGDLRMVICYLAPNQNTSPSTHHQSPLTNDKFFFLTRTSDRTQMGKGPSFRIALFAIFVRKNVPVIIRSALEIGTGWRQNPLFAANRKLRSELHGFPIELCHNCLPQARSGLLKLL